MKQWEGGIASNPGGGRNPRVKRSAAASWEGVETEASGGSSRRISAVRLFIEKLAGGDK